MKFIKKNTFYKLPVYEFNLPAGHSCPGALGCKVLVDRETGLFTTTGTEFRCYAAASERFPSVRESRWKNYESVMSGENIAVPTKATHVRIHGAGDFFSQKYFDAWLDVCLENEHVIFWAFTKSIRFWVNRITEIPKNLTLQASYGSKQDYLINKHGLKFARVYTDKKAALSSGLPIDTDDSFAMSGVRSFALLDNFKYKKTGKT